MSALTRSTIWQELQAMAGSYRAYDLHRNQEAGYVASYGPLALDYRRHMLDDAVLEKLLQLADARDVAGWREKMFSGAPINYTENRAVLHTALRAPERQDLPEIAEVRNRLYDFAEKVRHGHWRGATGKCITDIVNIGIGGSDLGPKLVVEALRPFHDKELNFHFVSNVDATHLVEVLRRCNPQTTLFIIASKTFTTIETLTNARTAKDWLVDHLGEEAVASHFVAVAAAPEKVAAFGIDPRNMFEFWDWVGGRYSVWSAIGLPAVLAIGPKKFDEFLAGAYAMDQHFLNAPFADNLPVLMAMIGIWNRNFLDFPVLAILPYDQYLAHFPAYLQQLDMESNGKSVDRDGQPVDYQTGPVIFGEAGTNGQHAFYQLLHQGTTIVPCDFIVVRMPQNPRGDHHKILLANALAQPDALAFGRTLEQAQDNPYKVFSGNRPSSVLHVEELTPHALGMLIALYEHKVFVQSVIWNLNAFDQPGVELGKEMALQMMST